jgi:hypothetical protein
MFSPDALEVLERLGASGDWDAFAFQFFRDARRFADLAVPVLLQVGSESERDLYHTDSLAAALPECRIESLSGQAHEGMTTAPEMYAESSDPVLALPECLMSARPRTILRSPRM